MSDQEGRSETVTSDETGAEEVSDRTGNAESAESAEAAETPAEGTKTKATKARTAKPKAAKSKTKKPAKPEPPEEPAAPEGAEDEPAAKDAGKADSGAAAEPDGDEPAADESADTAGETDGEAGDDAEAEAKKRLPRAQDISGAAGFTPHGLSRRSGARGTPKPLSPAARRRRRRRTLLGAATAVALAAAGTGVYYALKPSTEIAVSGAFGKQPKVTLPKIKPGANLQSRNLITGKGPAISAGDLVVVNYVGYAWQGKTSKRLISSYSTGRPESLTVGQLVPGIDKGLTGKKAGSRVLLVIPPKQGFGPQGNPQLGLKGTDTLVFVMDVLGSYGKGAGAAGTARELDDDALPEVTAKGQGQPPEVKIPDADAPEDLKAETLIEGSGPVVGKGQSLVAHYEGRLWRNGETFDSSWRSQQPGAAPQPAMFPIGIGKVVPGWDKGLVGKKVGSRVLLVIPSKEGYGEKGAPQGGIKGDDTLVFVVDILGAH